MFIIIGYLIDKPEKIKYLAMNQGYFYWSDYYTDSYYFLSYKLANIALKSSEFTENIRYSNGEIHPPRILGEFLNKATKATLAIEIQEIKLEPVQTEIKQIEIKVPKGYLY